MKDCIVDVRAFTLKEGGGGDYHNQEGEHWIVGQVSTPMSRYPEYKMDRRSWGINVMGTLVVEIETKNGTVGFGVSTGGVPAAWIVEHHLKQFVIGKSPTQVHEIWDQMFRASLYYGRKGVAMNAISAIDLALWDTLGRLREEPVYELIGGAVRKQIDFYATGPRPDLAKQMGFIGGKIPLVHGPADGEEGILQNASLFAAMRERCGDEYWLMADCYMSLDLPFAERLIRALEPYNLKWIEECFLPDDYWSYKTLKSRVPLGLMVTTGEHESTRYGFRLLLEMGCADIIQPDVTWCGGLTELLQIASLADAYNVMTVPHGSSVYSYHFMIHNANSPLAEFVMMEKDAKAVIPMFSPLLLNEPVPENGQMKMTDEPGFGVELNRSLPLMRMQ